VRSADNRPVLRDQADEYAAVWGAFQDLGVLADHRAGWAGWANGRTPHRLLMALIHQPEARAAVARVQRSLQHVPGVELHPPEFLHISIQSLGFEHDVQADLGTLAAALSGVGRVPLLLGAPNAFQSAVFLEVHSAGRLRQLRRDVRDALGPPLTRLDPYPGMLFHLTVGYFGPRAEARTVRAALRAVRGPAAVWTSVDELSLVELPTDQRVAYPALRAVATFPLA
jgi:2'-5' RNA ligase